MKLLIVQIAWPVLAYLAGSIPSGLLIIRWVAGTDIRRRGSGNIGATNVRRIAGGKWAAATLLCDMTKGMLPVMGAIFLVDACTHWLPAITALAAIGGHMYPVYLKFKPSGKGVATSIGAFLPLAPVAVLIAMLVFTLSVLKFRRISAGSLTAVLMLPPGIWFTRHDLMLTICSLIAMVLIVSRHEGNLKRLACGEEPRFDQNRN